MFMQSNCNPRSRRDDMVRGSMQHNLTVDARGACLNNTPRVPRRQSKVSALREHKFRICTEGLLYGWMPSLYFGAPNVIVDFALNRESIIDHGLIQDLDKIAGENRCLMLNKAEYDAAMR